MTDQKAGNGLSKFSYTIYIKASPEALWNALRDREAMRAFWFGHWHETSWAQGANWKLMTSDGKIGHSGELLEVKEPRLLVIRSQCEISPALREEGYSRLSFEITPAGAGVKLFVTHEIDRSESVLIANTSRVWPLVLSSLKTFLETGAPLDIPRG
jgi:uncharacterized protein YndB with AHSA1/START domain